MKVFDGTRSLPRALAAGLLLAVGAGLGCSGDTSEPDANAGPATHSEVSPTPDSTPGISSGQAPSGLLRDRTQDSGIGFVHATGGTGQKYLPEIMGAGGAVLDYDGDGLQDVFLVQSGPLPWERTEGDRPGNRLFRNLGNGSFEDVTPSAGVGDTGYGLGAVAGDYDNDGDPDLYVLHLGDDKLYRNNGDGTFSDATREARIDSPLWGSSAAFFDGDLDGDLDLYVVNYLDFSREKHIDCGKPSEGILAFCHPDAYEMAPDLYLRNRGDGTFEDATREAGMVDPSGKGLGVVAADFTNDGWPDVYVANDSTPNFLYRNLGDGTFEEAALYLGVGHNEEGRTEAGMGTDAGDVDGDGFLDLFVTNLNNETNALYLGGPELFTYSTRQAGLYSPSFMHVGFGTDLVDLDNDRDLDLVVTNGNVVDNPEMFDDAQRFRQPSQVFINDGTGNFVEVPSALIPDLAVPRVGRGTLTFDYDADGGADVLITFNGGPARLFRNEIADRGAWIGFDLSGGRGNQDGMGARVAVRSGGKNSIAERKSASSYETSGDPRLLFGLADRTAAERVEVRWPSGARRYYSDLRSGHYYHFYE